MGLTCHVSRKWQLKNLWLTWWTLSSWSVAPVSSRWVEKELVRDFDTFWLLLCFLKLNILVMTVSLGGGHLHSKGRGPDLHLTVLPAGEEERLHPCSGDLLQHRVYPLSQEDRLLH